MRIKLRTSAQFANQVGMAKYRRLLDPNEIEQAEQTNDEHRAFSRDLSGDFSKLFGSIDQNQVEEGVTSESENEIDPDTVEDLVQSPAHLTAILEDEDTDDDIQSNVDPMETNNPNDLDQKQMGDMSQCKYFAKYLSHLCIKCSPVAVYVLLKCFKTH